MPARSVTIELEVRNKQARKALEGIESGFTSLRKVTTDQIPIRFDADQARASLEGIESGVTNLRKATQQTSSIARRSTGAMASGFGRASQNVKGTGTAVMNLNRIVQDSPFGVMGVANNIEPFIQSFQRLKQQTGSTTSAFTTLLKSAFTGPGALITIVSAAMAAITAIQMGLIDLGGSADESKGKMKALLDAVKELEGVIDRDLSLLDKTERDIQNMERAIELVKERQRLEEEITLAGISIGSGRTEAQKRHIQQLENEKTAINEMITEYSMMEGVADKSLSKFQNELDKLIEKQKRYSGEVNRSDLKLNAFIDSLQSDAQQAINKYTAGVDGGRKAINMSIEELENYIQSWRILANNGETQYIPIINSLKETVKELRKELEKGAVQGGLTDQQIQNFEYMGRLLDDIIRKQETAARRKQFQQTGLGGTLENPFVKPEKPKDIIGDMANIFQPIPQSAVDKESEKLNELVGNWEDMEAQIKQTGDTGERSMQLVADSATTLANALAQSIVRGEELEGVLKSLATQLISTGLVKLLFSLFGGGGGLSFLSSSTASFASGIFDTSTEGTMSFASGLMDGFAHGTDGQFPGMGIIGERGPEMLVAPPLSSIITNENIERMHKMRNQARQGARNAMNVNSQNLASEIRQAVMEGYQMAAPPQVDLVELNEKLNNFQEWQNRIGN